MTDSQLSHCTKRSKMPTGERERKSKKVGEFVEAPASYGIERMICSIDSAVCNTRFDARNETVGAGMKGGT